MRKKHIALLLALLVLVIGILWLDSTQEDAVPPKPVVAKTVQKSPTHAGSGRGGRSEPPQEATAALETKPVLPAPIEPVRLIAVDWLDQAKVIAGAEFKIADKMGKAVVATSDHEGRFEAAVGKGFSVESTYPELLVVCKVARDNKVWCIQQPVLISGVVYFETPGSGSYKDVLIRFGPSPRSEDPERPGFNEDPGSAMWARGNHLEFPKTRVGEDGSFRMFVPRTSEVTIIAQCPHHYAQRLRVSALSESFVRVPLKPATKAVVAVVDEQGRPISEALVVTYMTWRGQYSEMSHESEGITAHILGTGFTARGGPDHPEAGVDQTMLPVKADKNGVAEIWPLLDQPLHFMVVPPEYLGLPARFFRAGEPVVMRPVDPFPTKFKIVYKSCNFSNAKVKLAWRLDGFSAAIRRGENQLDSEGCLDAKVVVKGPQYDLIASLSDGSYVFGKVTFGDSEEVTMVEATWTGPPRKAAPK